MTSYRIVDIIYSVLNKLSFFLYIILMTTRELFLESQLNRISYNTSNWLANLRVAIELVGSVHCIQMYSVFFYLAIGLWYFVQCHFIVRPLFLWCCSTSQEATPRRINAPPSRWATHIPITVYLWLTWLAWRVKMVWAVDFFPLLSQYHIERATFSCFRLKKERKKKKNEDDP